MNAFERKMAEQVAMMTTLVMAINSLSDEFFLNINYNGNVKKISIDVRENEFRNWPKILNGCEYWELFCMSAYLTEHYQKYPTGKYSSNQQIIHALQQIHQGLIEGRTHEQNHERTTADLFTTAAMDERHRTHGQLHPFRSPVRHGPAQRLGREQTGRISATA